MPQPIKPATTVAEQIAMLQGRGMQVDVDLAEQWLTNVHYYRLAGYWYPYRSPVQNGVKRGDNYETGTTFADVAALYEFDRKLRTLVHDAIERIETGLRARMCNRIAQAGPLAYKDSRRFRPSFEHSQWLGTVQRRVNRARDRSTFVQHNLNKYGPDLPIWALVEVLDFSDLSKLFAGLGTQAQFAISESMGVTLDFAKLSRRQRSKVKQRHPMVAWFEQLTIVRNTAAHHGRLWNISFIPVSGAALRSVSGLESLPEQSEQLYGALTLMAHLLRHISPGTSWPHKVCQLLDRDFSTIAMRSASEMGFPASWHDELPWQRDEPSTLSSSPHSPTEGAQA